MAGLADYLSSTHRIWDELQYSTRADVDVSELWHCTASDRHQWEYRERVVHKHETPRWLNGTLTHPQLPITNQNNLVLRVLWLTLSVQRQTVDISNQLNQELLHEFKLGSAARYCRTLPAGIGKLNHSKTSNLEYYFSLHPKAYVVWTKAGNSCLNVICTAEESKINLLKSLLRVEAIQAISDAASMPAVLCAILLAQELEKTHDDVKQQVRQVEVRTGHHNWKSRREGAALGDLTSLSAQMSGCSTRCGSCLRKVHLLFDVIAFVKTQLATRRSASASIQAASSPALLSEMLDILSQRAKISIADNEFIQRRVDIQLNALHHLVAQNDAFLGQQMASDCRLVAMAAQRDSSSMKVIAVVTMCFLPGSVVAAVFSMPLFDWNAQTHREMLRREFWFPRLTMYLTVTIPFMLLTFAIWALWLFMESFKDRKRARAIRQQLGLDVEQDEAHALAQKRATLQSNSTKGH